MIIVNSLKSLANNIQFKGKAMYTAKISNGLFIDCDVKFNPTHVMLIDPIFENDNLYLTMPIKNDGTKVSINTCAHLHYIDSSVILYEIPNKKLMKPPMIKVSKDRIDRKVIKRLKKLYPESPIKDIYTGDYL